MRVLGFDLEQYNPNGDPAAVTLPISCAVTTPNDSADLAKVWFSASGQEWGDWAQIEQADPVMNDLWLDLLIDALMDSTAAGVPVVTWHGAAYDLACLAHHSGRHADLRRVTLASIDLHLLFMAVNRHRLGLKTAAAAVGSRKGGEEIADGEEASKLWPDAWEAVLTYCKQDVRATLDVFEHLARYGGFNWISSKKRVMTFTLPANLRDPANWTVESLLRHYAWPPAPAWITEPCSPGDAMFAWLMPSLWPAALPMRTMPDGEER